MSKQREATSGRARLGVILGWTALALAVIAALVAGGVSLVRYDQRALAGTEIVYDDFGFRVLSEREEGALGASGELRARGVFRVVTLEVANHAKRVDYRLDQHRVVLCDDRGREYEADPEATRVLDQTSARTDRAAPPTAIPAGASFVQRLVYDVPADARGLTLRLSWGGEVIDTLDQLVFGDRRFVLR
jgi:hypothetical protein